MIIGKKDKARVKSLEFQLLNLRGDNDYILRCIEYGYPRDILTKIKAVLLVRKENK